MTGRHLQNSNTEIIYIDVVVMNEQELKVKPYMYEYLEVCLDSASRSRLEALRALKSLS